MKPEDIQKIPALMDRLYSVIDELECLFGGRHFTPDGHLVGSLGEVWAAYLYDLKLLPASAETHDATTADGRNVQIKATQGTRIALSSQPEYLIVLQLQRHGQPLKIYNGPGAGPWNAAGKKQKNGQRPISVARLKALMAGVGEVEKIGPGTTA